MKLTAKQEAFAQAVADGLNQSDAYRKAYDASKMSEQVIHNKASLLIKGEVGVRVESLKQAIADKQLWTREDSVRTLKSVIDDAERGGDKVSAVKELNAMHGYNAAIKTETTLNVTRIELVALK